VHPAGLPPADSPFEAEDDNNFTTDAEMACRAVASAKAGGSPRIRTEFSPVKSRDFTVKVCNPIATRRRILPWRDAAARSVLCSSDRNRDFASREMACRAVARRRLVEHQGIAPCISAWKADVCLSTPMLGEMKSRAGMNFPVLQMVSQDEKIRFANRKTPVPPGRDGYAGRRLS
jgi:hypothetical protein